MARKNLIVMTTWNVYMDMYNMEIYKWGFMYFNLAQIQRG